MCGIVGGHWRARPKALSQRVSGALRALQHRGPDDQGREIHDDASGVTVLAQTRLAILDLSPGGHQPFISADGRHVLTYNGEIYNFKELRAELAALGHGFSTESDTEVLMQAWREWGADCLLRLTGMFAFAIHDRKVGTLTLARDGFGIKPLFYQATEGSLRFASDIRALLALDDGTVRPNVQRAYAYLVHNDYDSDADTFIAGVRHLKPGHVLTYDLDKASIIDDRPWWRVTLQDRSNLSFADAAEQVRALFLEAVRLHLRSDVPVGAALSGGIDSSAIVCAMRVIEPDLPIHTFSYVEPGSALSEEPWIDMLNAHVKATPHKVRAGAADLVQDIDALVAAQGEPFGSTSIYAQYLVFREARRKGITVTLEGQGADELLAGYDGYPGLRLLSLFETRRYGDMHAFASAWSRWPNRSFAGAWMHFGREILPDSLNATARKFLGRDFRPDWLDCRFLDDAGVEFQERRAPRHVEHAGRRVRERLAYSLQQRGLPHLLRHGDRNAMAHSVEGRVPFLTPAMAELLLSLPERYLISDSGETKSVFRAAMRGLVPDAILDRKDKIGFATPERDWVLNIAPQIRDWLDDARDIPFIRHDRLVQAFDAVATGRAPFSWQVWRWVNYVRWHRSIVRA